MMGAFLFFISALKQLLLLYFSLFASFRFEYTEYK